MSISRRDFLKGALAAALLGGAAPLYRAAGAPARGRAGADRGLPNILILVFDTLSAAHMSLYGYRRETTPNFARLAGRSAVFHRHRAAGNFTVPGTASLLTGVYPWSHRGLHLFGTLEPAYAGRNLFSLLDEDYFTAAYTHNALAVSLLEQFFASLDRFTPLRELALLSEPLSDRIFPRDLHLSFWGERVIRGDGAELPGSLFLSLLEGKFELGTPGRLKERYGDRYPRGIPHNYFGSFFLLEDAIDWIQQQAISLPRPFLGYFHLFPPHEPYRPRRDFAGMFRDGWEAPAKPVHEFTDNLPQARLNEQRLDYDRYVAQVDAELGRLFDFLDRNGVLEDTYFIVTSDHGQLFERGIHGHSTATLYEPLLHVPLLVAAPGQQERRDVFSPTSCVDLLPTLLGLAGRPLPEWCEGRALPGLGGPDPDSERSIYAVEAKANPKEAPLSRATLALVKGGHKLIRYTGYPGQPEQYELYDLETDPEEMEDLYARRRGLASDLRGELAAHIEEINATRPWTAASRRKS
jgi:arylsulfatase A-like enzyme